MRSGFHYQVTVHLTSLESTREATIIALSYCLVQLLHFFCALQTSCMHHNSKASVCQSMNQLLIIITLKIPVISDHWFLNSSGLKICFNMKITLCDFSARLFESWLTLNQD